MLPPSSPSPLGFQVHRFKPIRNLDGGWMLPMWRDWDVWTPPGFVPRMVYASTIPSLTSKQVVVHTERTTVAMVVGGKKCDVWVRDPASPDVDIHVPAIDWVTGEHAILVIPPGWGVLYQNSNVGSCPATIVVAADRAWSPDHDDTLKFDSWSQFGAWADHQRPASAPALRGSL